MGQGDASGSVDRHCAGKTAVSGCRFQNAGSLVAGVPPPVATSKSSAQLQFASASFNKLRFHKKPCCLNDPPESAHVLDQFS